MKKAKIMTLFTSWRSLCTNDVDFSQDVFALNPRTCDHIAISGKREFSDMIKLGIFKYRDNFWIVWVILNWLTGHVCICLALDSLYSWKRSKPSHKKIMDRLAAQLKTGDLEERLAKYLPCQSLTSCPYHPQLLIHYLTTDLSRNTKLIKTLDMPIFGLKSSGLRWSEWNTHSPSTFSYFWKPGSQTRTLICHSINHRAWNFWAAWSNTRQL